MLPTDREELRARARKFVESAAFVQHYDKKHISARQWYVGQLIRCMTIVGLYRGIRGILDSRNQAFATVELAEGYRQLVDSGRIVQCFVVINSGALHGNPKACAPALMIASLAGTDEGDAVAKNLFIQIANRIHMEQLEGPADEAVQAMIANDGYQAFRKRPLPAEFTGGREAHFLDVHIDNELLRGNGLFSASEFYYLVDPSRRGLILQIPQVDRNVPPTPSTGG
ncbi:hypothetical protein SAMN05444166_0047 [Singulisphaera sp. GP187]|uniref:hypothetical protein n=1 Tax=Singulisphaera sp. GP187 TaxID=1882752 RepID=UPI00092A6072|nr:hypothetical protein [Singulisphaera sp. GP187]SIN68016.1 hypothetical protein SAMN05444166_0047 [Singulisphaera sp. GP187]